MLINKRRLNKAGMVIVMSDITILKASIETTLLEISKQSAGLATGLQNAAPADRANKPNHTIQYLTSISDQLIELVEQCKKI